MPEGGAHPQPRAVELQPGADQQDNEVRDAEAAGAAGGAARVLPAGGVAQVLRRQRHRGDRVRAARQPRRQGPLRQQI